MVAIVERTMALLALVAIAVVVGGTVMLVRGRVAPAARDAALPLATAIATVATAGSLFFSEVAGYVPCALCWYQRIAMYPLVVVLGVAAWRRDGEVFRTAVPIAAIGGVIAVWHVLVERLPELGGTVCDPAAPCALRWVEELGFLTLPTMALVGFVAIIVLTLLARTRPRNDREPDPSRS
jgi:disulfide bond formation protein DsbB